MSQINNLRMPAEWEPHRATWIAWPHEASDWPDKFEPIRWVYLEIVRILTEHNEQVEILCHSPEILKEAQEVLALGQVQSGFRLHLCPNNRSWLRDSAPSIVYNQNREKKLINWNFNAWAKYDNFELDQKVPEFISSVTKLDLVKALRPDNQAPFTLEGGAIEVDGQGTLITTEECLLSKIQERNPGLSREQYEEAFAKYLGITKTIWLANGCQGDDTHGHIDDLARFVAPGKVVLALAGPEDPDNQADSQENYLRLKQAKDATGSNLEIIPLPMPKPLYFAEQRLPASYANFYIANQVVLVPTFNDANDRAALNTIAEQFPNRAVIGIASRDLILGLGTLHCLTQQEPDA